MASATRAGYACSITYTRAEVLVDAAVHGAGIAGAVTASVFLLTAVARTGDAAALAAAAIYAGALIAMPSVSAVYNLTRASAWSPLLQRLDQATIFVMIAGTYTPFGLVALGGVLGQSLLVLVWATAVVGASLKLWHPNWLDTRWSVALYLALGWCALPALGPLAAAVGPTALAFLGLGGLLYTVGVIFHLWTTLPFHNPIWHAFVVAGAACHVFAVFDVLLG
jgi:hemolysin III